MSENYIIWFLWLYKRNDVMYKLNYQYCCWVGPAQQVIVTHVLIVVIL